MAAERKRLTDILRDGDARAKLRTVWETTTAATDGYAPLPAGTYRCTITEGALFESRSGTPGYKITFKVADGPHAGRLLWSDLWLSEAALAMTKRDLARLGVVSLEQLEQPVPQGFIVDAKVATRTSDSGTEYNVVKGFDVITFEPPKPDPFAPSATPEPSPTPGDDNGMTHEEI